jgi:hypothetical protein
MFEAVQPYNNMNLPVQNQYGSNPLPGQYQTSSTAGFSEILSAAMLQQAAKAQTPVDRQRIKDQFMAIFYKEMLKQVFTTPSLSGSDNDSSLTGMFSADALMDQLALKMAQSDNFSADQIFPTMAERTGQTE